MHAHIYIPTSCDILNSRRRRYNKCFQTLTSTPSTARLLNSPDMHITTHAGVSKPYYIRGKVP